MFTFKKKKEQEKATAQEQDKKAVRARAYFMLKSTNTEWLALFERFNKELQDTLPVDHTKSVVAPKVLRHMSYIETLFFSIPLQHLDDEPLSDLFCAICIRLERSILEFRTSAHMNGLKEAWNSSYNYTGLLYIFNSIEKTLGRVRGNVMLGNYLVKRKDPGFESLQNRKQETWFEFPSDDENLVKTLNDLKELWQEVKDNKYTVDDEFFVEQVTETYLPDLIKLYTTLQSGTIEQQVSGTTLLQEQLDIILRKLQSLKDKQGDAVLAQLEQHKDFLVMKTNFTDSSLVLDK